MANEAVRQTMSIATETHGEIGCPYGDPSCPCQDGDPCHYEGKDPMLVQPQFVRNRVSELVLRNADLEEALKACRPVISFAFENAGERQWIQMYEARRLITKVLGEEDPTPNATPQSEPPSKPSQKSG